MNLIATVVIFAIVIYLQGFRIEIPVKSNKFRGQRGSYPVKLFYTSNMPIMLQSALTSNVFIVSQMLFSRFPANFFVKMIGIWEVSLNIFIVFFLFFPMCNIPSFHSQWMILLNSVQHPVSPTTCPHLILLKKPSSTPSIHRFTLFSCLPLVRSSQKLGSKYQVLVLGMSLSSLKSNKWFVFRHSPIYLDISLLLGHGWSSRRIHVQRT